MSWILPEGCCGVSPWNLVEIPLESRGDSSRSIEALTKMISAKFFLKGKGLGFSEYAHFITYISQDPDYFEIWLSRQICLLGPGHTVHGPFEV